MRFDQCALARKRSPEAFKITGEFDCVRDAGARAVTVT